MLSYYNMWPENNIALTLTKKENIQHASPGNFTELNTTFLYAEKQGYK